MLETADLPDASSLALESFYKPRLKLDLTGMNGLEKWLWGGLLQVYLDMDRSDNYNGNYLGFRSRSSKRLDRPSFDLSTYSFILAATPKATATASGSISSSSSSSSSSISISNSTSSGSNSVGNEEIAAVVEICLERPTGKLAPPIQNPFRSAVAKANEQPYLCNLCVVTKRELVTAPPLLLPGASADLLLCCPLLSPFSDRRKGLGRLLCELCEELVQMHWQKDIMYLHVEQNNTAAQALYLGMGYELVTPGLSAWEKKMEGMESILYYSKPLRRRMVPREEYRDAAVGASTSAATPLQTQTQQPQQDADMQLLGINSLDSQIASNIIRAASSR